MQEFFKVSVKFENGVVNKYFPGEVNVEKGEVSIYRGKGNWDVYLGEQLTVDGEIMVGRYIRTDWLG